MSKPFLSTDFLLESESAVHFYEKFAAKLPIIDYHCHLSPKDIAENKKFKNLTEIWLEGDHYKWRAMRTNGIPEKFCTGDATPFEKFEKWAATVPYTLRNPLYHWTHLELKDYFGITKLLDQTSAREIYDQCTAMLQQDDFRVQGLLKKMNVEVVCTTDDPVDSLEHHLYIQKNPFGTKVLPTFRPDKAYAVEDPSAYNQYLQHLAIVSGKTILSFQDLIQVLANRIEFFHAAGCRLSDHGLENLFFEQCTETETDSIFKKVREGHKLSLDEIQKLKFSILSQLCILYHQNGWVQQFHLGAMRNNNSRMMRTLGPDTGFDSIGDFSQAQTMASFFNSLDQTNQLAKTILYNLNPSDNEMFVTMCGNFNDGSVPGKMQYGSAWWFLDQKDGMEKQLNTLSNMGLLSKFVGMITDSRSFLSYPRHEYFRRILCNIFGKEIDRGELPHNTELVGKVIQDICYFNAKHYFNF